MNREIEFRARLIKDKFWLDHFRISNCGSCIYGHGETYKRDEVELTQYTGLKDKNGKKIFEGDVVKFWANPKNYGGYKGHNYIAAVEWDQAFLQFIFSDGHGLKDFEFLEVVGNIFENPELLTEINNN